MAGERDPAELFREIAEALAVEPRSDDAFRLLEMASAPHPAPVAFKRIADRLGIKPCGDDVFRLMDLTSRAPAADFSENSVEDPADGPAEEDDPAEDDSAEDDSLELEEGGGEDDGPEEDVRADDSIVYVLELEGGKFYVGKTLVKNFEARMAAHASGEGSRWTRMHPVRRVISKTIDGDPFAEDRKTKELMAAHGIDNVRGGTHCQIELSEGTVDVLRREIRASRDACFLCGGAGHFANACTRERDRDRVASDSPCERCGRNTHSTHSELGCFARYHIDGRMLSPHLDERKRARVR